MGELCAVCLVGMDELRYNSIDVPGKVSLMVHLCAQGIWVELKGNSRFLMSHVVIAHDASKHTGTQTLTQKINL